MHLCSKLCFAFVACFLIFFLKMNICFLSFSFEALEHLGRATWLSSDLCESSRKAATLVHWLTSCHSSPHSFFGSRISWMGKGSGSACSIQPLGVPGVTMLHEFILISCCQMLKAQPWVGEKPLESLACTSWAFESWQISAGRNCFSSPVSVIWNYR